MQNDRGFSLLELLIVVVVIGVIAVIAIPNMMAARQAANEGSSVSALRTLYSANMSFAATLGTGSYAGTADDAGDSSLTALAGARLVDPVLGSGEKSGYSYVGNRFEETATETETFYFAANPVTATGLVMTGSKRYGVQTDGVIRFDGNVTNLAVPFDEVTLPAALPLEN